MIKPLKKITSVALPLLRINVDTDAIIPSREMKRVSKKGLAEGLFAGWRYLNSATRELNPDFILNDPKFQNAQIILSGANFGCGSSREHAVWALQEYGFRVIIAPSFGSIFFKNCIRNGILLVMLDERLIQEMAETALKDPLNNKLTVDLETQYISMGSKAIASFTIAPQDKSMLIEGLDAIDLTLKLDKEIRLFEEKDRRDRSWAYLRK